MRDLGLGLRSFTKELCMFCARGARTCQHERGRPRKEVPTRPAIVIEVIDNLVSLVIGSRR